MRKLFYVFTIFLVLATQAHAGTYAQVFQSLLTQQRASGVVLSGGKAYFYAPGTENLATIYTSRTKATPAANPATLSADGTIAVYGDGQYDVKITTSAGVQKFYWYGVSLVDASSVDSNFTAFRDYTSVDRLRAADGKVVNIYDVASYSSMSAAIAAIGSTKCTLRYGADISLLDNLTIPATMELQPYNGAIITIASGKTLTINGTFSQLKRQAFAGDGAVAGLKYAMPEWFGSVATDAGATINKTLLAMSANSAIELTGSTYPLTTTIDFPETSFGIRLFSKVNSAITVAGTIDAIDLTAQNENYGWHTVEGITITGPNNYYAGQMTNTTGVGIRISGTSATTNVNAGYNTVLRDVVIQGFKYGLRLQCVIGLRVEGKSFIRFNQYGVFIDGGATNANKFFGTTISLNSAGGVYSAGTTGGSLTDATSNAFYGCLLESNHPYGQTGGIAIYLNNSYDFVFDGCYSEDHEYGIVITNASKSNRFINHRNAPGAAGNDKILISGASTWGNTFHGCKSVVNNAATVNVETDNAGQLFNQFIDCEGYNFIAGSVVKMPYVSNMAPTPSNVYSGYGALVAPPQGAIEDVIEGTTAGKLEGIGTATATLHVQGKGEVNFGSVVAAAGGNTTVTTIEGAQAGQLLVLWNYQNTRTVTIKHTSGTGNIVLKPTLSSAITVDSGTHAGTLTYTADAVMTTYGQMLVLYVASNGRAYEIGRNW